MNYVRAILILASIWAISSCSLLSNIEYYVAASTEVNGSGQLLYGLVNITYKNDTGNLVQLTNVSTPWSSGQLEVSTGFNYDFRVQNVSFYGNLVCTVYVNDSVYEMTGNQPTDPSDPEYGISELTGTIQ